MASNVEISEKNFMIREGGPWSSAWKVAAFIGAVGALTAVAGAMTAENAHRFVYSYIFGYFTILTIALGALFFVLIQRLTSAGWSVTVRRVAEFLASGLPVMAVLALPILVNIKHFDWYETVAGTPAAHASLVEKQAHAEEHAAPAGEAKAEAKEAAKEHGAAPEHAVAAEHGATAEHAGHEGHDPNHVAHLETLEKKKGWFNLNFFYGRAVFYILAWVILGTMFFNLSVRQDKSKEVGLTLRAQAASPVAMMAFALSLTFSAFDWVMALDPSWFSTIFGVYVFSTAAVASLAVIILITMSLRDAGYLKGVVNVEHFHDLGKLMFGFNVFWAYIAFSQFLLIWYAGLPEETTYYHYRWDASAEPGAGAGPWAGVSLLLLLFHFVVPFFLLLSRNVKRKLPSLKLGAGWLLVMHAVDWYWFVMPNFKHYAFEFHWLDIACPMAVGGIYFAYVFFRMTKHALIPVGDPRIQRAIHFHNA